MSEEQRAVGRPSKPVTLINKTKGLRYVGELMILPDDKGVEISKEAFEQLKATPVFAAQLDEGEFEVK
jgi:glutamate mutase epsilon subunit